MGNLSYVKDLLHIGIAVQSISIARKQYELFGFKATGEPVAEPDFGVVSLMMTFNHCTIELLEPIEAGKESPIDSYIKTKPYKMYHLAYSVTNLDAQIAELQQNRFVMIGKPCPSKSFNGRKSVFMFNRNMGIIELAEV